eukprot:scaffold825_cov249-Pinguiococcus_pyrenoidosus.AAC.52
MASGASPSSSAPLSPPASDAARRLQSGVRASEDALLGGQDVEQVLEKRERPAIIRGDAEHPVRVADVKLGSPLCKVKEESESELNHGGRTHHGAHVALRPCAKVRHASHHRAQVFEILWHLPTQDPIEKGMLRYLNVVAAEAPQLHRLQGAERGFGRAVLRLIRSFVDSHEEGSVLHDLQKRQEIRTSAADVQQQQRIQEKPFLLPALPLALPPVHGREGVVKHLGVRQVL